MLPAIFITIFFVLPTNGWLSYKIYRSAHDPNNLKLKIDGSIYLGEETHQNRAEDNAFNTGSKDDEDINILTSPAMDVDKLTDIEDNKQEKETDAEERVEENREHETMSKGKVSELKWIENNTSADSELASLRDQLISLASLAVKEVSTDKALQKLEIKEKDKPSTSKGKIAKNEIADDSQNTLSAEDTGLRIAHTTDLSVTRMWHKKHVRHKVQDDTKVRKFTNHIYRQTLKAFEQMKQNSDPYTRMQIESLAETYKKKFMDFVQRTRQTDIKTSQGTQNVILHTLDTSNLILKRIMNFLKSDIIKSDTNVPSALREGGALRLDKEVDTVKETEYEHACKKFGVCRSSQGFRTVLQDIISILLKLPDHKLLQVNDAATEVLKNSDLTSIADSVSVLYILNRAIKSQERIHPKNLRTNLMILYGVLSKSHLPLMLEKGANFAKSAVKRTVYFRKLLNAAESALPPNETNKREWAVVKDRLNRWKDDSPLDVQEIMQLFVDNIQRGVKKRSEIKQLVEDIVESNTSIGVL